MKLENFVLWHKRCFDQLCSSEVEMRHLALVQVSTPNSHFTRTIFTDSCCEVRASPPIRVKGSWQALWRGLGGKSAPPLLPGLFTLARALQTSGSTHYHRGWALLLLRPHSGASSNWIQWIVTLLRIRSTFRNISDSMQGWRDSMQGNGGGVPP